MSERLIGTPRALRGIHKIQTGHESGFGGRGGADQKRDEEGGLSIADLILFAAVTAPIVWEILHTPDLAGKIYRAVTSHISP